MNGSSGDVAPTLSNDDETHRRGAESEESPELIGNSASDAPAQQEGGPTHHDSDGSVEWENDEMDDDLDDLTVEQIALLHRHFHEERVRNREANPQLPSTVTTLSVNRDNQQSIVYLIGTAHFSEISNEEVAQVIQKVCPDRIILELDPSRSNILIMDEAKLIEESKSYNLSMFRRQVKEHGIWYSVMHYLLLRMSTSLVEQLGMAPGGEFRAAARACEDIPGCMLFYGDRPVGLTLQRAFSQLSIYKRIRLACALLSSLGPVSREDVERLKKSDLVEAMVKEMQDQFPVLSRVFVDERDRYLARTIFDYATKQAPASHLSDPNVPLVLVAVVGMGHVAGIVRYWDSAESINRMELCDIPKPSRLSLLFRRSLRWMALGGLLYGGYCLTASLFGRLRGWFQAG